MERGFNLRKVNRYQIKTALIVFKLVKFNYFLGALGLEIMFER